MKILLINDYGTPTGGAELMTLTLRAGLRERGHDARLFTSSARPLGAAIEADYTCLGSTSRFRTLLQSANVWAPHRLRAVLDEFAPDIVHVRLFLTQLSPLILPLLRDVPSILHLETYRSICPLGSKMRPDGSACHVKAGGVCYRVGCLPLRDWGPLMLQMRAWRVWRDAFDLIVANSGWVQRRVRAEGIEASEVVWNGVPIQPSRSPLTEPPTVSYAGRFVREKGLDVLIQAMAQVVKRIPETQLLLAGDGPERSTLEKLVVELGLRSHVTLPGHISRAGLERHFAGAWVHAVPSRWEEPFGIVAAEAMMRGTAVVASGSGGLSEIVRDQVTGLLVPPGDVGMLADGLERLLSDRGLAERLGRAGREVALRELSAATFVEKWVELYDRVLVQRGHRDGC